MTDRRPPPPQRPAPPPLESYRPSDERSQRAPRPGERTGRPDRHEPQFHGADPGIAEQPPLPQVLRTGRPSGPPPAAARSDAARYAGQERSGFLSGFMIAVVVLIMLAGGLAAAAAALLPADFIRDQIVAAVKQRTGRDLTIAGGASFKLYPSLGVSMKDVSLSAAPGAPSNKPLVSMASLDAEVALLPLLKREVRIGTLVLRQPRFNLEVDSQGRKSWTFAEAAGIRSDTALTENLPKPDANVTGGGLAAVALAPTDLSSTTLRIENLKLDDVRIESGALAYRNALTNSAQDLADINVRLGLQAMSSPLTAAGSVKWRDRKIDFDGSLTSLEAVQEDRPAKLVVTLVQDATKATFDGSATFRDTIETEGILSAKSPSMRNVLAWLGTDLPPSQGFGPLEAKGLLRTNAKQIAFSSAEILLDRTTANGQITLETSGARPYIKAALKIDELNLNTYASDASATTTTAAEPPRTAAPDPAPAPAPASGGAQSIEDLLARDGEARPQAPGPKVKGFTQRRGWSEEPYRLASFALLDADAKLSIGRLFVRDIKVGQTEVSVALKNRVLKTTIDDVRLYDGRGRGFITMDASSAKSASMAANLTFEGIAGRAFLKDAADIDKLDGKGRIAFTLAGQGLNERQLVETLNGKAEFAFADGAIVGINIPQMIRAASEGRFNEIQATPTEKTDFSEFSSTWIIAAGTAQNQDMKLVSPLLRLTGSGNVMLPPREVDYLLRPRIVADLAGQGAGEAANGFEIPVRMHGNWEKPKFTPDLSALARDPSKAVDTLKEIGKQLKGKNAGEIVEGIFGKGTGNGQPAPAKKLLDQFLRPQ